MSARLTIVALACLISASALALADEPRQVNVPAGNLIEGLESLAKQCGVDVIYPSNELKGLKTRGVSGTLEPKEAFRKLIEGTPLMLKEQGNALLISLPAAATRSQTSSPSTVEKQEEAGSKKKPVQLEEVIVTGSRIPVAANQGAQEVHVYTKEAIEQSGQTTVADFLNTLPSVSIATTEFAAPQGVGGATTVQLRGLNVGTTLVLLNGRRVEQGGAAGGYFFDLNTIPSVAVERIEIVADGSSAIYGSDAIAGVVNIILKKDFDGFEASAKYGGATGIDEWTGSAALRT